MYTIALEVRSDDNISQTSDCVGACASKVCTGRGCPRLASEAVGQKPTIAETSSGIRLPLDISDAFLADILEPYRPDAKYLKSAQINHFKHKATTEIEEKETGLMTGSGRFSIPKSCYIEDTGHFNAVEFNICYNQLAFVLFGKALQLNILQSLRFDSANLSFADFKRQQLSSMMIVSIDSHYYKMLKSDDFQAELTINRISAVKGAYFYFTTIAFSDVEGVKSKGSVLLAYNPVSG